MSNFSTGDNESIEKSTQPALCENGCGFFANATCMGLCSKCYRDTQRQAADQKAAEKTAEAAVVAMNGAKCSTSAPAMPVAPAVPLEAPTTAPVVASVAEPSTSQDPSPPAKTPSRCQQCRKKVGLTGFKCRCGQVFCGQHRYAEAHCCTFDYKTLERQKLAENNPLVQASKVQKL